MPRRTCVVVVGLFCAATFAASAQSPTDGNRTAATGMAVAPDSATLEKELQRLPWVKFRAIIEGVPKLKADVDRYGPTGWKFVEVNYQSYGWKKNINKLDDKQRSLLVQLLRQATGSR